MNLIRDWVKGKDGCDVCKEKDRAILLLQSQLETLRELLNKSDQERLNTQDQLNQLLNPKVVSRPSNPVGKGRISFNAYRARVRKQRANSKSSKDVSEIPEVEVD